MVMRFRNRNISKLHNTCTYYLSKQKQNDRKWKVGCVTEM